MSNTTTLIIQRDALLGELDALWACVGASASHPAFRIPRKMREARCPPPPVPRVLIWVDNPPDVDGLVVISQGRKLTIRPRPEDVVEPGTLMTGQEWVDRAWGITNRDQKG